MNKEIKQSDIKEGDRIKFTFYSNIDPYPVCIGKVNHVYGVGYITSLLNKSFFHIDVTVESIENNHWKTDLIGHEIRIRNDFNIEILEK